MMSNRDLAEQEAAHGKSSPAEPLPVLPADDTLDSFDDDLGWIVSKFVERTGASGGVLSIHHDDGDESDLLYTHGELSGAERAAAAVAAGSPAALARNRRRGEHPTASDLAKLEIDGESWLTLALPIATDSRHRIVLTTCFADSAHSAAEMGCYAAHRLQPVLAGYFKLWLLNRSQRRRLDGLASALNFTDIAIFLLDGAGDLLFINHAARGLLDETDGVRRVASSLAATDVADALRLRVAIEHVIAAGPAGMSELPIVPLHRRGGRRALIASVMPVERPPGHPGDPTAVLYIFSPDINVGRLLRPICDIYRLTQAETRLVGLLIEGLSVSEAAERMRVKVPTLRTYLKQIFAKTGTARQSDLVRLMMGSLIRTRQVSDHKIV